MIVLLDVDGVVADIHKKAFEWYFRETGVMLRREQITMWKFASIPGVGDAFDRYLCTPGFFTEMPLYMGAFPFVLKLNAISDLKIVTAVRDDWKEDRIEWCLRTFPFLKREQIFVTSDKASIEGEVIIDDAPHNLRVGERVLRLLVDQPWNQSETNFYRINAADEDWTPNYPLILEIVSAMREIYVPKSSVL